MQITSTEGSLYISIQVGAELCQAQEIYVICGPQYKGKEFSNIKESCTINKWPNISQQSLLASSPIKPSRVFHGSAPKSALLWAQEAIISKNLICFALYFLFSNHKSTTSRQPRKLHTYSTQLEETRSWHIGVALQSDVSFMGLFIATDMNPKTKNICLCEYSNTEKQAVRDTTTE